MEHTTATDKPIRIMDIDGTIKTLTDRAGFRRVEGSDMHCLNIRANSDGTVTLYDDETNTGFRTSIRSFARMGIAIRNRQYDDIINAAGIDIS